MTRRVMRLVLATLVGAMCVLVAPPIAASAQDAGDDRAQTCPPRGVRGDEAVVRLAYVEVLGRCPDAAGYVGWVDALEAGLTAEQFARRIAYSSEALGLLVDDAYQTVLDRPAEPGGRVFWVERLRSRPATTPSWLISPPPRSSPTPPGTPAASSMPSTARSSTARPSPRDGRSGWPGSTPVSRPGPWSTSWPG